MSDQETADFWEGLYAERDRIWSGRPNQGLVSVATGLPPGRALDLGCGEGGDTVWMAEQGWQVTAVDIAPTAIERGRAAAAGRGVPDPAIEWVVADLRTWEPAGPYDLVSACFLQSPVDFPRSAVLQRAAATVASGGHLLLVSHAEPPPWSKHRHADQHFPTVAEELAGLELDEPGWDIVIGEVRAGPATGPDGEQATLRDNVILARRR